MRRITMWFVATVAVVVLLFSYKTSTMGAATPTPAAAGANAPGIVSGSTAGNGAAGPPDNGAAAPTDGPTEGSNSAPNAAPTTAAPNTAAPNTGSGSTSAANLVVNGSVADTRWGPVQVQVRITGGKITDVKTLQQPSGNERDFEINSYAVPQLRSEVLQAQSANIDAVSGATVTSDGYIESLQAALDSAHFKD